MNKQYLEDAKVETINKLDVLQMHKDVAIAEINAKFDAEINEKQIELKCIDNLIAKAPEDEVTLEATLEETDRVGELLPEIETDAIITEASYAEAEETEEVQ